MKSKKTKQVESQILLPRANPNFLGHENILADLFTAFTSGKMPCGWLISGPAGIGKATLAYRFARFILYNGNQRHCDKPTDRERKEAIPIQIKEDPFLQFFPEDEGIASSRSLRSAYRNDAQLSPSTDLSIPTNSRIFTKVSTGSHPDLLVLGKDAAGSKSSSGDILVEEARKIGSFLHLTSSETPYRIIIIDSIDNMNANAANSILKLLEEPPSNSMFILISHAPGRLLPTIRSRCRHLKMQKPDAENALQIFNNIAPDVSEDIAMSLLELGSFSPGAAYDLHINQGFVLYENIIAIIEQLPRLDIMAMQKLGDSISGKANEDSWRIFGVLINKIITDITRRKALEKNNGEGIDKKPKLLVAIDAKRLVEIWQEINYLLEDADNLHLERKAIIVKIFSLLSGKSQ